MRGNGGARSKKIGEHKYGGSIGNTGLHESVTVVKYWDIAGIQVGNIPDQFEKTFMVCPRMSPGADFEFEGENWAWPKINFFRGESRSLKPERSRTGVERAERVRGLKTESLALQYPLYMLRPRPEDRGRDI